MTTKAYPELKASDRVTEPCGRCGGSGNIGYGNVAYTDVKVGAAVIGSCFDCAGRGTCSILVSSVRAREARQARKAAEALKKAAEYATKQAEREAAQRAREAEWEAKRQEERDAAEPVPSGRITITGVLLSVKSEENHFSYYAQTVYKALVKDDRGFKVWGTLPKALADELYDIWYAAIDAKGHNTYDYGPGYWMQSEEVRGQRVSFGATVEPSRDDDKFGFFKRATQARVLTEVAA